MKLVSKFLCLALLAALTTACSSGDSSDAYVDTFVTLMQRSQPVLNLGTMPLRFYCNQNRWPSKQEILTASENQKALQIIDHLGAKALVPRGFLMKFRLLNQGNRDQAPYVLMKIPFIPTQAQCERNTFSSNDLRISITQKDNNDSIF